ncbi:MAG: hypothetical protein ACPHJ1_05750 [Ilumatobacteraceae bacterium]
MNTNRTFNRNIVRGITGLAIAGLAGAALSAGSVAASGTEICMEPGPDGIPRIVECPPAPALIFPDYGAPLDYFGDNSDDVDYGALLDYLGNTDSSDDAGSGFSGIEVPTPIDPSVFAQTVPEMVDPEQFEIDPETIVPLPDFPEVEPENPFLGTDDDAEPELAQPEAEVAPEGEAEVAPEPQPEPEADAQPEAQPEAEVAPEPEAQPEVRVNNSEVAPEELPVNPESDMPEAEMPQVEIPEVETPEAVTPEIVIPNTDADTDVDVDGTTDLDDAGLLEAAPVEVFTDATDTDGANIGLYAGILLILAGGGSLAAIAATRRDRD